MKKFDVYELIGILAETLRSRPTTDKNSALQKSGVTKPETKLPSADKNTTIEMIRRHDLIKRRISERERERAEENR